MMKKMKDFTCGIGVSSDEKYYFISTSDHTTSEIHCFSITEENPKPKLFKKKTKGNNIFIGLLEGKFLHTHQSRC